MMALIRALLALSRPFSMRMTFCELNGALIGVIAGALFGAVWLAGLEADPAFVPLALPLWLPLALVLALFCWAVLFGLLCGPLRYAPASVAGPLLVSAVLTCVLTIYLCNLIGEPLVFFAVGLAVGALIGWLLCLFCRKPPRSDIAQGKEG